MDNQKISIIIPIYNVEKYLKKCLDSVMHQTYTNLEVILVDDGSTDQCSKICDQYASEDQRIVVIHQANMGLSGARNAGIEKVTGEFVLFLDSDDYIAEDYCERMLRTALADNADIVVGEIISVDDNDVILDDANGLHFQKSKVVNNRQAMQMLISQKEMKGYAWGKLYRKNVIDGIKYPVGKVYEDRFVLPHYFQRAACVALCKYAYAYYRIRATSISHNVSLEKLQDLLDAENWMIGFCEENYPDLTEEMRSVYFGRYIYIWILLYDSGNRQDTRKIVNKMREVYKRYAREKGIRMMHRLSYKLIFFVPGLYRRIIRFLKIES